ncbi:MAG TPA: C39 family peptidase [Bradyrhizobium sp.]|nr:C39 family peptidase [Bradyrhizobium sp.]
MPIFQRTAGDKTTRLDKDAKTLVLVLGEHTTIDFNLWSNSGVMVLEQMIMDVDADDPAIVSVGEPRGFNAAEGLSTYDVLATNSGSTKLTARPVFKSYADPAQRRRDWSSSPVAAELNVTVFGAEYRQSGGTWGNLTYGSTKAAWKDVHWTKMAEAGCGPTSLAMIIDYLERLSPRAPHGAVSFAGVTPADTMKYTSEYGRAADDHGVPQGTSGTIMMNNISRYWPDYTSRPVLGLDDARALLRHQKPLVFLAKDNVVTWKYDRKGDRVEQKWPGHFMVVLGFEGRGDPFWIADSSRFEGKFISASELQKCAMWVVERWQDARSVAGD